MPNYRQLRQRPRMEKWWGSMLKPYCVSARSARLDEQLVGCRERGAAVFAHEVAMGTGGEVVGGGTVPEM